MKRNRIVLLFSFLWLGLFIFQAWWTPPHVDELYYWRFSKALDWGYFDHPPMVALMIYLSDLLFDGSMGIRALTILTTFASFFVVRKMLDDRSKDLQLFLLISVLPLLHLYGFITTPDVPLFFFGTLFFYFYQRVVDRGQWSDYLLWGLIMGMMLYGKYHGALLIIFTLLSNVKLFLSPKTYVAGVLGLVIWAPHIWWQYTHDFMTFQYHLSERAGDVKWFFPFEYLGNLIVLFNPFLMVYFYRVFRRSCKNVFESALYYTFVGFIAFFGLQSFRVHIQPQWLILTYIPFIILTVRSLDDGQKKTFQWLCIASMPLFIALHVFMSADLLKIDGGIWRKDKFAAEIAEKSEGKPVVFFDSFQDPSIFEYYQPGSISHSFNRAGKRKNQFNIWMQDTFMNGQEVYVFAPERFNLPDFMTYKSFDKLKVKMLPDSSLRIENPYSYSFTISSEEVQLVQVSYDNKKVIQQKALTDVDKDWIKPLGTTNAKVRWNTMPPGTDHFGIAVKYGIWPTASVYAQYKVIN